MSNNANTSPALQRIIEEDAVEQLRRRAGRMATLGSENGELKLDWVEGVARLLADPVMLEEVEGEARDIWQRGIRHIIWAGMGGSVLTVRVLTSLGFCAASSRETAQIAQPDSQEHITIYPLDSTDPAALNAIVRQIAGMKNQADPLFLSELLANVLMIGVSMGMTSEEPITHLAWFADLLGQAQLPMAEHLMVMTLPGSYLDQFAKEHHAPSRPLQPDGGTGTGGRMSAPATRVFLLPAALAFVHQPNPAGLLRAMLRRAWELYDVELATTRPDEHPFARLAAALSEASTDGACLLLLRMPQGWEALIAWIEQLMEESLGKGGKGVVVFPYHAYEGDSMQNVLTAVVTTDATDIISAQSDKPVFVLHQPYLAATDAGERLAALAASFLGWQLSMALFGYLRDITFAGQPAVENYKARARALRMRDNPLSALAGWNAQYTEGNLTLFAPEDTTDAETAMATHFAGILREARAAHRLSYLDGTINGEASPAFVSMFGQHLRRIGNDHLGVPVKLRRAPADYHSTEQSEMDGPPSLISLRLLARQHEPCMIGMYDDTFLRAQAISTWQAMLEQGRSCFLLVVDGTFEDAIEPLNKFFERVVQLTTPGVDAGR
ncbi:MAG TPA: hypothetical protein VNE38_18290 [Ktedonobacteraceae bacterium]|nr:hypothetical protein [Ktedonobacteraceae bacterium]